jgi:hypothetical protein
VLFTNSPDRDRLDTVRNQESELTVSDYLSDHQALLETVGITTGYVELHKAAKTDKLLRQVLQGVENVLTARHRLSNAVDHLRNNLRQTDELLVGKLSHANLMATAASDHDVALTQLRAAVDALSTLATLHFQAHESQA